MSIHARYILCLLITFLLISCQREEKQFTLLSHKRTGIDFRNPIKEFPDFNSMGYNYMFNGAGVAAGDINNDNLVDLFFTGNFVGNRLYLNKGNFRFENISEKAGISAAESWSNGVVMADVNGDGFLDIYVANSTDQRQRFRKNFLFMNNGDLTFTERAEEYGIADYAYTTHSAFLDYDKDGDLDLFSLNHSVDKYAMFREEFIQFRNSRDTRYVRNCFVTTANALPRLPQLLEFLTVPSILDWVLQLQISMATTGPTFTSVMTITRRITFISIKRMALSGNAWRSISGTSLSHPWVVMLLI